MDKIRLLRGMIEKADRIVFFGGAGVSTESGIPDFRSDKGLYSKKYKYPAETILSSRFFYKNPEDFYDFYKTSIIAYISKPNPSHIALAQLERQGKLTAVITQNIDGLHQMAGSSNVIELHGSSHRNYCINCGKNYSLDYVKKTEGVPRCELCNSLVRPDVVLYGESLKPEVLSSSIEALSTCDLLIIGGTSLVVYPAAALIEYFNGEKLVLINKEHTSKDNYADLIIRRPIGEVFSELNL